MSRRTNPQEEKYHSSRLELIAAVWSAARLRSFLLDMDFVLVTDCSAITYLNTHRELKPQVACWSEQLTEFTYKIRYRPGSRMQHVDAISRAPVEERTETPIGEYEMTALLTSGIVSTMLQASLIKWPCCRRKT